MKYLKLTALFSVFVYFTSSAQIRIPVPGSIKNDVQKIVSEYPQNFQSIRGEVLNQNPQSTEYLSLLKVGDAKECVITKYSSGAKAIYSWQALMFNSEDFEAAAKKYKWLYNQLKGMNVYYIKDQYTLRGAYDEAEESKKFASSVLTLTSPPGPLKKLKVEASLQFEFPEWKVSLLVYEKEREDDERGDVEE
jgi:hypothetical protein